MNKPVTNYDHKTIQFRRGTTIEWRRYGAMCVPAEGEMCVEFFQSADGKRTGLTGTKIGNGTANYSDLPYMTTNAETDPVFVAHPAYQITQELIDSWNDDAEGIGDAPDSKTYSRVKGSWVEAPTMEQVASLEERVEGLDPDGDKKVEWDEIEGKPTEFPPSDHDHDGVYLKDESDPTVPAHVKSITQTDIDGWNTDTNYDDAQIKADLAAEVTARADGDAGLQQQIDGLDLSGDSYDDTQIKADLATETQARTAGDAALQGQIDALEGYDDTGIQSDLATETQARIDGDAALGLRIDAVEGSVGEGGGFIDAPNDAKLYGRQSEAWAEIVMPEPGESYDDTGIKADLATETQARIDGDTALQGQIDSLESYDDTQIKADLATETQARIDGDAALQGQIDGLDLSGDVEEAPEDGKQYARQDATWSEVQATGSGNPVVISDDPPASPEEGDLWYSSKADDEGLYCWDGVVWFEAAGANGADGADGKQIWSETTPDGDIFYDKGDVSVSGTVDSVETKANRSIIISRSSDTEPSFQLRGTADIPAVIGLYGGGTATTRIQYNKDFELGRSTDYNLSGFTSHLSIEASTGNATFAGTVSASKGVFSASDWGVDISGGNRIRFTREGLNYISTGATGDGGELWIETPKAKFSGEVSDSSGPLMSKRGLISTLSTLRNATKDETTLEGLRDSIGNAIGGLIEKFEAEIAAMPAPEAGE